MPLSSPTPFNFCVVGVFGEDKQTLVEKIENLGHSHQKYVTKLTNYLITPSDNNSKTTSKAKEMKTVQIITPAQFQTLFSQKKREHLELLESDESDESLEEEKVTITPQKKQKVDRPISIEQLNIKTPQKQSNVMSDIDPTEIYPHLQQKLSVPFVNRKTESKQLAKLLLEQKSEEKGPLPILSQHFGSGKTSIVANFRDVLIREKENLTSSVEGNVENLMKASLVRIIFPHNVTDTNSPLLFNLVKTALCKALKRNDQIETSLKEKSIALAEYQKVDGIDDEKINFAKESLINFLIAWCDCDLAPIILFFDEMDLPEEAMFQFWYSFYFLFGSDLSGEPNCKNIYFITAGKSSALTKMGRGFIKSPLQSEHVVLNMLEIDYIQELIETTNLAPTISMKTVLQICCGVTELDYFTKILYEYTGGIPRLVVSVFKSIIQYLQEYKKLDFSSREKIANSFAQFRSNILFKYIRQLSEINPFSCTSEASKDLKQLYRYAVTGLPICPDKFRIDLIYDLNIGVENFEFDGNQYLKLIVPKFIQLSGPTLPTRVTILKNLFSNVFPISQITDKGAFLEVLVRDSLISSIIIMTSSKQNLKWKDLHVCFAESTLLSGRLVSIDAPYVKYMPKIVTHKSEKVVEINKVKEIKDPWTRELSDIHWPKIKKTFFDGNRIIHPAPKSRSSDFYFYLPPTTALAFAIKNYPSTTFTYKMLQEEIDKAALAMQGNELTEIVLLVFCNGIKGSKIHVHCTKNDCLQLNSGIYRFTEEGKETLDDQFKPNYTLLRETPKQLHGYSTYSKNDANGQFIHVPKGMEVIVLGEKAFNSFFSEEDKRFLDGLSGINVETTNYQELISTCYSIPLGNDSDETQTLK